MSKEIKLALLMATSLFMEMLDGTIVTTAQPQMAAYFHTSMSQISLLISSYLVTTAIFIPMSGWLASRFGNKRIWLSAILLFTISSMGSALSPNLSVLIVMRVLQGFSGALMTPTARLRFLPLRIRTASGPLTTPHPIFWRRRCSICSPAPSLPSAPPLRMVSTMISIANPSTVQH